MFHWDINGSFGCILFDRGRTGPHAGMTETLEASGAALTSDESEVEEAHSLGWPTGCSCNITKSLGKYAKIHERSTTNFDCFTIYLRKSLLSKGFQKDFGDDDFPLQKNCRPQEAPAPLRLLEAWELGSYKFRYFEFQDVSNIFEFWIILLVSPWVDIILNHFVGFEFQDVKHILGGGFK